MFGIRKRIAIKWATRDLQACVGPLKLIGDLPYAFYEDAYALGFFFGYSGEVASIISPNAKSSFRGVVITTVLQRLYGQHYDAYGLLAHISNKTPEFI